MDYLSIDVGQYAYRGWRHCWGFGFKFERWSGGTTPNTWHPVWKLWAGPVAISWLRFTP